MSMRKSIENLFENPAFDEESVEPLNRQLYFIGGKSIVLTDDGAYKQYTCYPQFWEYGAAVQEGVLKPLSLNLQEQAVMRELLASTEILNENGFAPVSIYPAPSPADDRILVCVPSLSVMLIMSSLSFSRLNENSLLTLPENLQEESDIMTRHAVTVAENGQISKEME